MAMTREQKGKSTKKDGRERGVMVRSIVPREVEDKLRAMATAENRTLSAMIALLLTRAADKK